tara:strand:+ start:914 stop:2134 length:1221 start_codon:yes stop_codon:yes gene_type:complete
MNLNDHLAVALRDARLSNARQINQVRAVGAGAFTAALSVNVYIFGAVDQSLILVPTSIYFLMALTLAFGSKVSPTVLKLSRFAIPVYDMPTVFVIQLINIETNPNPGNVSEFSIALFVCLLLLSAYTLNARYLFISTAMAVILQQLLQEKAEIDMGGRLFSPVVFGLATWICAWSGGNRLKLVETVALANARRLRLQRYFSPGVGEILEERDEDSLSLGKDCELTIIFVDIRGFTSLSEQLSSREVIEILNTYHAHMVEVIFRHGGTLDKYLGDGLIAYFNAPVGQEDHAERAVACALDMEKEMVEVNAWLESKGKKSIKVGIGVHTGGAIVGDIGAPHRREFTVIGSAVNVTSRLEGMTKEVGRTIVVSNVTADLVEEVEWEALGSFPIRGCAKPMLLFSPQINS